MSFLMTQKRILKNNPTRCERRSLTYLLRADGEGGGVGNVIYTARLFMIAFRVRAWVCFFCARARGGGKVMIKNNIEFVWRHKLNIFPDFFAPKGRERGERERNLSYRVRIQKCIEEDIFKIFLCAPRQRVSL